MDRRFFTIFVGAAVLVVVIHVWTTTEAVSRKNGFIVKALDFIPTTSVSEP